MTELRCECGLPARWHGVYLPDPTKEAGYENPGGRACRLTQQQISKARIEELDRQMTRIRALIAEWEADAYPDSPYDWRSVAARELRRAVAGELENERCDGSGKLRSEPGSIGLQQLGVFMESDCPGCPECRKETHNVN